MDNIEEMLYGRDRDKKDRLESWVERKRRLRAEARVALLDERVPERRCSCCRSVKLKNKAWVTINERRSTSLEHLSKCLEQRKSDLNATKINDSTAPSVELACKKHQEFVKLLDQITKVQRSKICCRGCWIVLNNHMQGEKA